MSADHDHAAQVAAYGECVSCAAVQPSLFAPGPVAVVTEPHALVRHDAPDTGREAARVAALRSGTARHRVLAALADEDRTDEELQSLLAMPANTERPRRVECHDAGWITDSGARRPTFAGHQSIVWAVTDAGRDALRAAR